MAKATTKHQPLKDDDMTAPEADITATHDDTDDDDHEEAVVVQEVMSNHLDLMLEIVMQIRQDEDFAKSIYANCPRLQHLLDQHPDLRPVFEDPQLVRLNFEQVYRNAGGVLPEDKPTLKQKAVKVVGCIVRHPLFKVFRFLLVIKKCYNCVMAGGVNFVRGCMCGFFTESALDAAEGAGDGDADGDGNDSPESEANRDNLNRAADYMEDPEVREKMHEILSNSDPDQLAEAIENDPELRALRDSSPITAELMTDPDTMRIVVDPDNLRALSECPNLVEADFADPDWSPPDVERVPFDDAAADANADVPEAEHTEVSGTGEDDDDAFLEDFERGDVETDDAGGGDVDTDRTSSAGGKKAGGKKGNEKKGNDQRRNFVASIGTGLVDYFAGEIAGTTFSELTGGGDDGLDEVAAQAEETADATADNAGSFAATAGAAADFATSDVAGNLEDTMDAAEDFDEKGKAAASGAAGGGVAVAGRTRESGGGDDEEEEEEEKEDSKKKGRFGRVGGAIGGAVGALSSAAKETVLASLVGDDFAEDLVEKMEEEDEEEEEEEKEEAKKHGGNDKQKSSRQLGKKK